MLQININSNVAKYNNPIKSPYMGLTEDQSLQKFCELEIISGENVQIESKIAGIHETYGKQ